jgi:selenoprotein W-related protein
LAAEIQQKFGAEPELVKGRGGVFEVSVEGQLVFSKKQLGRFPEPGEIERQLRPYAPA